MIDCLRLNTLLVAVCCVIFLSTLRACRFHNLVLNVVSWIHSQNPYETGTNGIAPAAEIAAAITISLMLPKGLRVVLSHPIYKPKNSKKYRKLQKFGHNLPKGETIAEVDLMVVDNNCAVYMVYEIKSSITIAAVLKSIFQLRRVAKLLNSGDIAGYKPSAAGVVYNTLFLQGKGATDRSGMFFRQYTLADSVFTLPDDTFMYSKV